jgi:3-phosphoshikimate 1-carboxyvinyltransferase
VLIINALAGGKSVLHNLSDANDTRLMMKLIRSGDELIDIEDAGTTMRFLTAYFALTNQPKILTGTPRMQERPIGILVDALRSLGARINYQKREGYPPLVIEGFDMQKADVVRIQGDVSSQFISALMMLAPSLPKGLEINLTGKIGSRPYIEMTARLMRDFGAECHFVENNISVKPKPYAPTELSVESDWSAASYWFAFTALAENASIDLPFLFEDSLQGDRAIQQIMLSLGVTAEKKDDGMLNLKKSTSEKEIRWDFTNCPDLAQTIAVVCAAKGIKGHFLGLESLRIKETDRITALQTELKKIGADLTENDHQWTLLPSLQLPSVATFQTYHDHRMAMAFAPLATKMDVVIESPGVVKKSYPRFWKDLEEIGFELQDE